MKKGPRILLILKPSPAREALTHSLTEAGWIVDATPSTFRGVSGLAREPRRVVVIGLDDIIDEELEAIRVIRTDCPGSFILVTFSHVNRRKAQHAMELGADAYVLEPLNVQEVVTTLRAMTAGERPSANLSTREAVKTETEPSDTIAAEPALEEPRPRRTERTSLSEKSALKPQEIAERFPSVPTEAPPARAITGPGADISQEHLVSLRKLGASIAHEINNPLTTLSGWIQLLLRKANGNHDLHRTLISMKEEADRIADVVHELTVLTEPGTAEQAGKSGSAATDFNTLVSQVIDDFLATNGNASIQVKTVLTDAPLRVTVEADMVARAISDLLNSRYLGIGSSGSLVFRTIRNGSFAELHVYEPGSQMDLTALHKALQSLELNEGDSIGQDLSLARAKQIIDSCRGAFRADCQVREGLSFVVKFPVAD